MLTFYSFLQTVYQCVKTMVVTISKKMYRSAAVLTTGLTVVTVILFTSSGFGGGGKNALAAFSEREVQQKESPEEEKLEETELITEAKIRSGLSDSKRQGQLLVGESLTKNVQQKQQSLLDAKAEIEEIHQEILLEQERQRQREQEAEEAAAKAAAMAIPNSSKRYTDEDYQVLLRIVQAEAGICDSKGKILVANVILNRVRSGKFPNNITDVVYERQQFSPVSNGSINRVKITQQTVDCVNRALAGEDYSEGALYFMYRGGSRSVSISWFDRKLTFLFQHEKHEFFK